MLTLFERLTISLAAGSIEKSYIGLPDIASMSQANAVHAMLVQLAHSLKRAPEVERQRNTVLNEIIQTIEKKPLYGEWPRLALLESRLYIEAHAGQVEVTSRGFIR